VTAKEIKVDDLAGIETITDQINQLAQGQQAFTLTAQVLNTLSDTITTAQTDINGLRTDATSIGDRVTTIETLLATNAFNELDSVSTDVLSVTGDATFSGQATFDGLTFFDNDTRFDGAVTFGGGVEFTVPPLFNKDTAGFAVVYEGDRRVEVVFEHEYAVEPVVNTTITFENDDDVTDDIASAYFDADMRSVVVDKSTTGFTILLNKAASRDIRFSWTAFAVKDPSVFESVFEGLEIETPEPEPQPEPSPLEEPTPVEAPVEGETVVEEPAPESTPVEETVPSEEAVTPPAEEPQTETPPAETVETPEPPAPEPTPTEEAPVN
jgi:hypothetical protein